MDILSENFSAKIKYYYYMNFSISLFSLISMLIYEIPPSGNIKCFPVDDSTQVSVVVKKKERLGSLEIAADNDRQQLSSSLFNKFSIQ